MNIKQTMRLVIVSVLIANIMSPKICAHEIKALNTSAADTITTQNTLPQNILATSASEIADANTVSPEIKNETDTVPKKLGFFARILRYFEESNEEHPEKKFDITFLGGPSYSASTSVQLAVIAAGQYRSRRDSVTPQSNISVFAQGSISGFYRVGIFGNHFFPSDKIRINYHADFAHFPLKFWGIGYDMQSQKSNESNYTELQSAIWGEALWRLPHDIFIGPAIDFSFAKATKVERPELWNGEDLKVLNFGLGIVFSYDSRDFQTNASRGWNVTFRQRFYPRFLGNDRAFSSSELTVGWYKKFWKSGIMAFQLHGCSTYGDTPWSKLPAVDASNGIRGYYEGRYRDKNEADLVVELRQHIWRRNGIVVWAGVGTVFDKFKNFSAKKLLPSFGVGYRWEFKKLVNVRVDVGFGKKSTAFCLGINETF